MTRQIASAPAPVPSALGGRPLDIEESPAETLWVFFRRQPAKYWRSLALWTVTSFAVTAAAGFAVGTVWANLLHSQELTRLQGTNDRQLSDAKAMSAELTSRLRSSEEIGTAQKEELGRKVGELARAQATIESMQREVTGYERRLQSAGLCQQTKREFDQMALRAKTLALERTRLDSMRDKLRISEIDAEGRVLDGQYVVVKGILDGCAGR